MSMSNDELLQFAKLLDAGISSDNPNVKRAFRNFMLVASIAEPELSEAGDRPFEILLKDRDDLLNRVSRLEQALEAIEFKFDPIKYGNLTTVQNKYSDIADAQRLAMETKIYNNPFNFDSLTDS